MIKVRNIWIIIVIMLIIYSLTMIIIGPTESLFQRNIESQQYQGIIQNKFIDKNDHFANKIIVNGLSQAIHWKLYIELNIGDSVYKKKDDIYIVIYKMNGQKIKYNLLENTR